MTDKPFQFRDLCNSSAISEFQGLSSRFDKSELMNSLERGLLWLTRSDIRTESGGYKSEYDYISRRYSSWGGGDDCSLGTAGAILALLKCGVDRRLAVESGDHLLSLIIRKSGSSLDGAIPAGQNSNIVNSYYQAISIQAFCALYRQLGDDEFIKGAVRNGLFAVRNLQKPSGYLRSHLLIRTNLSNKIQYLRYLCAETQTWLAEYVKTFLVLYNHTRSKEWVSAARLLVSWLTKIQNPDGTFYKTQLTKLGRFLHAGRNLNPTSRIDGWETKIHPTSMSSSLQAFILCNRMVEANRTHNWLKKNLTPHGLYYENYPQRGKDSVLDVMPSAQYGMILFRHLRHLPESEELMCRIAKGIIREQISSDDTNANGGVIGLPRDPKKGHSALSWDTEYSILYLAELLSSRQKQNAGVV